MDLRNLVCLKELASELDTAFYALEDGFDQEQSVGLPKPKKAWKARRSK